MESFFNSGKTDPGSIYIDIGIVIIIVGAILVLCGIIGKITANNHSKTNNDILFLPKNKTTNTNLY